MGEAVTSPLGFGTTGEHSNDRLVFGSSANPSTRGASPFHENQISIGLVAPAERGGGSNVTYGWLVAGRAMSKQRRAHNSNVMPN